MAPGTPIIGCVLWLHEMVSGPDSWLLSNWVTPPCISYSTLVLWSCFSDWWENEWNKVMLKRTPMCKNHPIHMISGEVICGTPLTTQAMKLWWYEVIDCYIDRYTKANSKKKKKRNSVRVHSCNERILLLRGKLFSFSVQPTILFIIIIIVIIIKALSQPMDSVSPFP